MSLGFEVLTKAPTSVLSVVAAVAYVETIFSNPSLTELIFGTTPCAILLINGIIARTSSVSFMILCVSMVVALAAESSILVQLYCKKVR